MKKISKTKSLDFEFSDMKDLPKLTFLEEHILEKHQINLAELKYGKQIGKGGSAKVFIGEYCGREVCIKEILKVRINIQRYRVQFQREIVHMSKLEHPNILKFFGSFNHFIPRSSENKILYLCEFIKRGSLYCILKEKLLGRSLDLKMKMRIIKEIGVGIEYLHENGCIHGDLKSMNILMKEDLKPIICDFGFLQKIRRRKGSTTDDWRDQVINQDPRGTIYWMAPECVRSENSFISQRSDVWSLGVIIWEIMTESKPYPNLNPLEVKELLPQGKASLEMDSIENESIRFLLEEKCLKMDHKERFSIFEVNKYIEKNFFNQQL